MEGPRSELGDRIHRKYKKRISEKLKTGSLIGEVFEIDGKKYKITDGEIDFEKIHERMNKIINDLKK